MVALLDLGNGPEVAGEVRGHGPGSLGDPGEGQDALAHGLRRDPGPVAGDDAAGLELLDPFVGGGPADPDGGSELGVRAPAVFLEQLQEPGIDSIKAALSCHLTPIS